MAKTNDKTKTIQFSPVQHERIVAVRGKISDIRSTSPSMADTVMEGIRLLETQIEKEGGK